MTLQLRQYQTECLQSIHDNYMQRINRQLVHMATGAGKTVVFANLIRQMDRKTLVLAHTCELLDQAREKINMICPNLDVGIVKANRKEFDRQIVVSSIQSARQPETLAQFQKQGFSLCIYDEAHRVGSATPREVLNELGFFNPTNQLLVGFSATPFREDSKGLGDVFQKVVYHKSIKDLINLGYLCKPIGVKVKTDLDLSNVVTEDGDFKKESLSGVMDTTQMNELVVDTFLKEAKNRRTVCFSVTVEHAKNLANEFKHRGITSEAISGDTPTIERKNILECFRKGSIQVLTNCMILTEGWDCPEVDCVLIAKPTQSKGLYQQMAGRGLRLYPNKRDCLILDFGSKTHSLCSTAELTSDAEVESVEQKVESKISEFAKSLPPTINKKLKASIIQFDLLGDDFTWLKDGLTFYLKASVNKTLKIFPTAENLFSAAFFYENNSRIIAKDVSFEYAFASAEQFAKSNRALFTISDLDASWRKLPISDKQKSVFKSFGYRAGIDDLSRGQASLILSSGVLNKKSC